MYGIPVSLKALSLSTDSWRGLSLCTVSGFPLRMALFVPKTWAFGQCVVPTFLSQASFFLIRSSWLASATGI